MMESRKRPLQDSDDSSVSKKRILTGANGSPRVNGYNADDDEGDQFTEKLELFRKEAIYRRMKHYSRENERSQSRIQELERRKSTCEAGLAAISACWAQLIETIRLHVKPDDLSQVNIHAKDILDFTVHIQQEPVSDLTSSLGDTVAATQALLTKFVQLRGQENHSSQNMFPPEYQKTQNECLLLRSELDVLRSKFNDCANQRDDYHSALVAAENKLDRAQSGTVRQLEASMREKRDEQNKEVSEEPQKSPSSPAVAPTVAAHINGAGCESTEVDVLRAQLQLREQKITELERETSSLKEEKMQLEVAVKAPSLEHLIEIPVYRNLSHKCNAQNEAIADKAAQVTRSQQELHDYLLNRTTWEEGVINASNQALQDLKAMLAKRDADNVRLREQRDQQQAELVERRHKDSMKLASLQEFKARAESNAERVRILLSEINRYKTKIAAKAGDEELVRFLFDNKDQDVELVTALRNRTIQAERRARALEEAFGRYQDDHPDIARHINNEAEALEQLSAARKELAIYQQTYGEKATLPPDVARLASKLQEKEVEIQRLRTLDLQSTESQQSLYVELDKLSAAWEDQERQLKERVFSLSTLEDRLQKLSFEKAKSDNKYFAIMREKEAIENERQKLSKTNERHEKVAEHFTVMDKQFKQQIANVEGECQHWKKLNQTLEERLRLAETKIGDLQSEVEHERRRMQELNTVTSDRERRLHTKAQEMRAKDDELIRVKKDLEHQLNESRRSARSDSLPQKARNAEVKLSKDLERVAFCTMCRSNLRTTIITKCMHTFCRECVDIRLSTRQRKCPHCGLPFGQADVQTFFFN